MASTPKKTAPVATPASPKRKGVKRSTDITLSIIFLAVQLVLVVMAFPFVLFFGALTFVTSGAGDLFTLALFGPGVVFLITLIVGLVLMITKRNSWIATLAGLLVIAVPLVVNLVPIIVSFH